MTLGPVMGSGGLAVMLPPSALGVILAATANSSVGEFLLAIIVPGLMMARPMQSIVVVHVAIGHRAVTRRQTTSGAEAPRHRGLCVSARHHHLRRHRPDFLGIATPT
jgi:TRAP-type C4-dicarboxylate transport system permease large subunit